MVCKERQLCGTAWGLLTLALLYSVCALVTTTLESRQTKLHSSWPSTRLSTTQQTCRSDLDWLRIRPDDSGFQAGSIWPKPNTVSQNQIGSRLVLHKVNWAICGRLQLSLKMGNRQQAGRILPEPGPMILAHHLASGPDAFGQNLTRPSRSDPVLHSIYISSFPHLIWFCTSKEGPECAKLDLAWFWP